MTDDTQHEAPERVRYVLGFAFDEGRGRVALIRKDHPDWQAGKLNGVGGKIERGEGPRAAMVREFREEAGRGVPGEAWKRIATMHGTDTDGWAWDVAVFRADLPHAVFDALHGVTSEPIERHDLPLDPALEVIHNLRFLVPLAADRQAPFATFDYEGVKHAKKAASQDRSHHAAPPEQGRELKGEGLRSELDVKVEEFRRATKDRMADLDVSERERHADLRRALRFADEIRDLLGGEA